MLINIIDFLILGLLGMIFIEDAVSTEISVMKILILSLLTGSEASLNRALAMSLNNEKSLLLLLFDILTLSVILLLRSTKFQFGTADVLLLIALYFWLYAFSLAELLLYSCLLSLPFALWSRMKQQQKTFPFAPFITLVAACLHTIYL